MPHQLTREQGVEKLKSFSGIPVPIPVGSGIEAVKVSDLDVARLGDVIGIDIDDIFDKIETWLPWIAMLPSMGFLSIVVKYLPQIKEAVKFIQELIAQWGKEETAAMIAEAAA